MPTISRWGISTALLHPLACVGLFYSLALHMHRRLGSWPESIGEIGFPDGLILHAHVAQGAIGALLLCTVFVLPLALLFCASVPQLRSCLRYLVVYGISSIAAVGIMQLAPAAFLYWWWD